MYSGSFGNAQSTQLGDKLYFLPRHLGAMAKKKGVPLMDLLFMFGVLGSLYTLVLAEKIIF